MMLEEALSLLSFMVMLLLLLCTCEGVSTAML